MSGPVRYWIGNSGLEESECGAWVHYDDWLRLEEARFALEFRLELATKRNAELHALYETVLCDLNEYIRHEQDTHAKLSAILGTDNSLEQCALRVVRERDTLRRALDEAPHARDAARYAAWRDYILSNEERDELDLPDDVWMAQTAQEFDDAVDQWRAERTNLKSRLPRAGG